MKYQYRHLNDTFIGQMAGYTDNDGYTQYGLIRSYDSRYVYIDFVNDKKGEPVLISKVEFRPPKI